MTTYIIRHAARFDKSSRRLWRRTCGEYPHDTPLSTRGIRQAIERGGQLKDKGIERIYASPFTRTLQTAQIIASILELPITVDARLCEILKRAWFGTETPNLQPRYLHYPSIIGEAKKIEELTFPEGHKHVIARARDLVENEEVDNTLLVTHGTSGRRLTQVLIDFSAKVRMPQCSQVYEVQNGVLKPWPVPSF
jgi:broad specificity phosphatase PhoE